MTVGHFGHDELDVNPSTSRELPTFNIKQKKYKTLRVMVRRGTKNASIRYQDGRQPPELKAHTGMNSPQLIVPSMDDTSIGPLRAPGSTSNTMNRTAQNFNFTAPGSFFPVLDGKAKANLPQTADEKFRDSRLRDVRSLETPNRLREIGDDTGTEILTHAPPTPNLQLNPRKYFSIFVFVPFKRFICFMCIRHLGKA